MDYFNEQFKKYEYKVMKEAISRVRELAEKYETFGNELDPRFAPTQVFQGVAKELKQALDGEHE